MAEPADRDATAATETLTKYGQYYYMNVALLQPCNEYE